jgi:2-dehydro-3-deoxyglucarate aldolase/4-hydroxy-2-oxoheptanedioate aldolase
MNAANVIRLREKTLHVGSWLSIGSPVIAELAAECRFDWLLFDLEHGCAPEASLFAQLQALRGTGAAAIVRVGAPHADLIGRVLDWGADGIMVPRISSVAEAEACVQAAHYPPRGRRGFARTVRASHYGLRAPETATPPLIFAQIETIEGVENARAIARVDGIDVLFIGPADLRFDLEARPAKATRDYDACLSETARAAADAGKESGILIRDVAEIPKLRALGFTKIAIDSDLGILRAGYQRIATEISQLT